MIKEEDFWKWFENHSLKYLDFDPTENNEVLFSELARKLQEVNPDLCFEFGIPKDSKDREFIISAGGIKAAFPAVQRLVEGAPKMANWKITAFRPRKGGNTITCDGLVLRPEDARFSYEPDSGKINVVLYIKNYVDDTPHNQLAYLMLDDVLGEFDVETYIGAIERKNIKRIPDEVYPMTKLPQIVDDFKQHLYSIN